MITAHALATQAYLVSSDNTVHCVVDTLEYRILTKSSKLKQEVRVMDLGSFSTSLAVKNLAASKRFYEKLGFEAFGGDAQQNWLILKNGEHVIGLFQGMFEGNLLTFNPGWDQSGNEVDSFTDVRQIQRKLKEQGVVLDSEVDESTVGPASIMLSDPDGNQILIDQHR